MHIQDANHSIYTADQTGESLVMNHIHSVFQIWIRRSDNLTIPCPFYIEDAYIMAILSKAELYIKALGPLQALVGQPKRLVDLTESWLFSITGSIIPGNK